MVSAVAVDHRRGPPLPMEFRVPQRRDNSESKSPLPDDWSNSTKDLRDIGKWVDDLLGDG